MIFPSGWVNGLGHLRGLGREGYPCIVIDPEEDALCFYSKYALPYQCGKCFSMTIEEEKALLKEIQEIGAALKKINKVPVLFLIGSEVLLPFVIKYFSELEQSFIFTADYKNQFTLEDKKTQLETAERCGIDIPKSFFVSNEDDFLACSKKLGFPYLLKPRGGKVFFSEFGRQAFRIENITDMKEVFERVKHYDLILQEEIPGPDENLFTLGSYVDKQGVPRALFTGKKIKSNRDLGTCTMGIGVESPEVKEIGIRFLKESNYHGASQIELKLDERDKKYKFIEINNRLWKWHSLAIESGVNIPYIQFLDSIGESVEGVEQDQIYERRWWLSIADIYTMFSEMKSEENHLQKFIRDIDFDFVDGIGSWDDPLPAIVNFFRFKWIR